MESAPNPLRLAVLASGRGSNLRALIEARTRAGPPFEIVLVASDKVQAAALRHAESAGIPTLALDPRGYADRASFDCDLLARVGEHAPDLVVLAGFMRILDPAALASWIGRIVNIHPSLLPKYRGLHTHARALAARDAAHGASVHFVTPELDGGPVIAQAAIPIADGDTAETLAARLLPQEHRLLIACVRSFAARRIALRGDRVLVDGHALNAPLTLRDDDTLAPVA